MALSGPTHAACEDDERPPRTSDAHGPWTVGSPPPSTVDQPSVGGAGGLHHRLGEGRVAMDDVRELAKAALERPHVDKSLNQLRGARANDRGAQQLAELSLADKLDPARAISVDGRGANGPVADAPNDHVIPGSAGLLFGQSKGAHVGLAERRPGDVSVIHRLDVVARGVLD